jgi:hypothetical protein
MLAAQTNMGRVAVIAITMSSAVAHAQVREQGAHVAVQKAQPHLDVGLCIGVEGFIDARMRDAVGAGVAWAVRTSYGNPESIRVELAYVGSRQLVDLMEMGASLIGHGAEAGVRINVFPEARWEPFFFVGAGWSRFSITERGRASLFPDHDDVAEFPIGLGAGYRLGGLVLDLRVGFRVITGPDLLPNPDAEGSEKSRMMHRFGATTLVGYSF